MGNDPKNLSFIGAYELRLAWGTVPWVALPDTLCTAPPSELRGGYSPRLLDRRAMTVSAKLAAGTLPLEM